MAVRWTTVAGGALLALLVAGCSATSTPTGSAASPGNAVTSAAPTTPTPTTPTPTPTTPSAAPTLTTATPSTPGPSTPASAPAPGDPASVVEHYFAAINDHDYASAWALGGDHLSSSYAQFAAGFANTAEDSVRILSTSGGSVAVELTATNTDGSQQMFAGTYTVTGQQITGASISQVGAGPTTVSLCGAPDNPYGYNLCGRGIHVSSPPADICTYFTCIDNFWNGRGYMVECNDGTYSMSGGISGACSDHDGEGRPVDSG
jgi:hypothetical protein